MIINDAIVITGTINLALMYGILNFPFSLAAVFLGNTNIPPQTNTKANKVPMLVKSYTNFGVTKNIGIPTTKPVISVENAGVWYFGCISENFFGNNPSLLIAIHIRG